LAGPLRGSRAVIVLDEPHLSSVLREFVAYYNAERPHRTLKL